jgi:alpha-L-rhamnosidase
MKLLPAILPILSALLLASWGNPAVSAERSSRAASSSQGIRAYDLRCNYRVQPLGIGTERPRLSWKLEAVDPKQGGQRQYAYRIRAARDPEALKSGKDLLWDSGKVISREQLFIPYGGPSLLSGERVYWSVKVWDGQDVASADSAPAWFEAGMAP